MNKLSESFSDIVYNFRSIMLSDILDILIVAFVVYELIAFLRRTRAAQLARGLVFLLLTYAIASYYNLRTVSWLLDSVLQLGFLAMVVMFQPEAAAGAGKNGPDGCLGAFAVPVPENGSLSYRPVEESSGGHL